VFKNFGTIFTDERSGRSSLTNEEDNNEQVKDIIVDNPRVAIDEMARNLRISHVYAHGIIQVRLVFMKFVHDSFQKSSQESSNKYV
jgi:hypothetical protein